MPHEINTFSTLPFHVTIDVNLEVDFVYKFLENKQTFIGTKEN